LETPKRSITRLWSDVGTAGEGPYSRKGRYSG